MELLHLLLLTTNFAVRKDIVWDVRCSTGPVNICELNDVTLTTEIADQRTFFPATNLRIIDGWVPVFDTGMAQMLRRETKILVIARCHVQYFVVREMLRVLILTDNWIKTVSLHETEEEFEMEFMKLDKNDIANISFVSRMTKLNYVDLSENRVEVLEVGLFENHKNLSLLELRENRIKSIEASSVMNFPVENLGIASNQLTDLNTKHWRSSIMRSITINDNKIQSINTVQLRESAPKLSSIIYDNNTWNCERLESLQFYLKMRPHKVYNFTRSFAQCNDSDSVKSVALKLPELFDLSERKRNDLGNTINHLIEDQEEKRTLSSLQFRFAKAQHTLLKMAYGLSNLKKFNEKLKNSLEWFDFFDKLE